jgi:hypothetical protein
MRHLLRMRALALVIIGVLTAGMVIGEWAAPWRSVLLPLVVAYFLFNFGFVATIVRPGSLTKATRLGTGAVLLNFVAMFLSRWDVIWAAVSTAAIVVAFAAAFLLLKEAAAQAA